MEEAKGMEIEIEMAEEAEKAAVPRSVGMRRRRNKADAQASGLPDGTALGETSFPDTVGTLYIDGNIDWNNSENHGGRINGSYFSKQQPQQRRKRLEMLDLKLSSYSCIVKNAMKLRLRWWESQGLLKIFEGQDARNALPSLIETLLEEMKSKMLPVSSIVIWDAEEKQSRSETVKLLEMVKDVAYDADDVLDEITIKAQPEHKLSSMSRASSILSPFGSNMELKSTKIGGRLDHIAWQKDDFSIREQAGDREEGSSDCTQNSSLVEKLRFHGKDNQKEESLLEISEKEMLVDGGEGSSTREATEWTLLMTNLLLECMSATFDQLGFALPGMVTAFVALVLSTIDLFRVAQKEKITWDGRSLLPCFYRQSTRDLATRKPFGNIVEYFGFFGAVWQCFYCTMGYAYARQNKDNPIKMSLLPFIFLVCLIFSKKRKHAHRSLD